MLEHGLDSHVAVVDILGRGWYFAWYMTNCSACNAPIARRHIQPSKLGRNYCSRSCHRRGQFVHGLNAAGYKVLRVAGKQVYEHRWVMSQHLGRDLLSAEHVHHRNGDKADNRISNLEILEKSVHHREHCSPSYDIELAKRLSDAGLGYKKIAQLVGSSPQQIRASFIVRGWHRSDKVRLPRATAAERIAQVMAS